MNKKRCLKGGDLQELLEEKIGTVLFRNDLGNGCSYYGRMKLDDNGQIVAKNRRKKDWWFVCDGKDVISFDSTKKNC